MAVLSAFHRPSRIVAAGVISILIFLFLLWSPQWRKTQLYKSDTISSGSTPHSHPLSTPATVVSQPDSNGLIDNAHRLLNADAFLPHFRSVIQLPGISMTEVKSSCPWPALDKVNFQFGADVDWAVHDRSDFELETRRNEWRSFIQNELLPYQEYKDRFKGRGIVIVAGNQESMKRVRVILRALMKLGSTLPIEIHYWGEELDSESKKNISAMWSSPSSSEPDTTKRQMFFNDLSSPSSNILATNHDGFYINYQLKTAAVINSRFAEPLLLDSDNIPIIDPAELYDSPTYKEHGTLFWSDIARTRPNNPIWGITNTPCRMDEYEQESGQLLVDKRRFWYHLQLAAWFSNGSAKDYYASFLLGDKDTFRFAWHALKTKYGFPAKWVTSVGTLVAQEPSLGLEGSGPESVPVDGSPTPGGGFYCGHSFAQHHPDGRVAFLHGGLIKTLPNAVIRYHLDTRGGLFQVYKRSDYDEMHIVNEDVAIKWDGAPYLPNRPDNLEVASCTDFFQVVARPLDEIVPGFEQTFKEIGGYWMLE
ncbi:hypothetical protein Plec18167_007512 [Paecilomyces lecythidis]|uniref:Glycosyltransferase family 71 protein n=1 Tax=Paecilomyces lecythidis TaxID=3004212 RepID=A0ABR3X359_9EURO